MSAPLSPIGERLRRIELMRDSAMSAAETLKLLGEALDGTKHAKPLRNLARRIQTCIVSSTWRVTTKPGEGSWIAFSNKRDCRSRFCPPSSAYMALRQNARFNAIIDEVLEEHRHARALFLTVTLPSQRLREASLSVIQKALTRFWKMQQVREHTLGHIEAVEVKVSGTPHDRTLHIHAHCIVMVRGGTGPDSYFANDVPRIHQSVWASWWQRAARLGQKPVVDIRAIRGPSGQSDPLAIRAALRETLKYACAPSMLFHKTDKGIVVEPEVMLALYHTLRSKQLVKFDRCFKDAEKRLKTRARAQSPDAAGTSDPATSSSPTAG